MSRVECTPNPKRKQSKEFAERLGKAMTAQGWGGWGGATKLAAALSAVVRKRVSPQLVASWLRGRSLPSASYLLRLPAVLGVPPSALGIDVLSIGKQGRAGRGQSVSLPSEAPRETLLEELVQRPEDFSRRMLGWADQVGPEPVLYFLQDAEQIAKENGLKLAAYFQWLRGAVMERGGPPPAAAAGHRPH
jgi:transcriptional regulator with XRE-family HTH domain